MAEYNDIYLDTPIIERFVSLLYIKEWTIRELTKVRNKRALIKEKYPGFPDERPTAAVVSTNSVNNAANFPSPSSVNIVNASKEFNFDIDLR